MPRTVHIRLRVEVPDGDYRSPAEIECALAAAFEVGSDDDSVSALKVECVAIEEA